MAEHPAFTLNGERVPLADADPTESLLRWLRRRRLAGTKEGCADGDCGACTVAIVEAGLDGTPRYDAVNSCLVPIGALPGREVVTVEALADGDALHRVQSALVEEAGSQCGYCTPGFVMSLYAAYYSGTLDDGATEGNLCRCTGYRPIRAATARLAAMPRVPDRHAQALAAHREPDRIAALAGYHQPRSIADALALKQAHPEATWIAGATDLGVALSHGRTPAPAYIALDRIDELQEFRLEESSVRIGAGVTLATMEARLAGLFPALDAMLPWFAARQVRNRATLGGNLGTASPIGDLLPVLLALDARILLRGARGEREVDADGYFLDYRRTARADDELVVAVTIPRRVSLNTSYKVAKRRTDDIAIVAAAYAIERDPAGVVTRARLAYGGVAAIPRRAKAAEAALEGHTLSTSTLAAAADALDAEFAPIDDHRASAAYRRALVRGLFEKFAAEHFA